LTTPQSRDLDPIEPVFAKIKALLRKAAERSVEARCERGSASSSIKSPRTDAPHTYLRRYGYGAS
jgi:hypothetical protein